jgi:hypothetical protein
LAPLAEIVRSLDRIGSLILPLTIAQIVDAIDGRLDALQHDITALQDAWNALGGAAVSSRRPAANRNRRTRTRRKASEGVSARKLERLLSENGGTTTSALAKLANAGSDQVLALLRELEAAGNARRTGQRRGTRWHAVTDEDRINERAAELATRSSKRS